MRYIAQTRSIYSFRDVRVSLIKVPDAVGSGQPSLAEAPAQGQPFPKDFSIRNLIVDIWWFVITVIGLKQILGVSVWLGIVLSILIPFQPTPLNPPLQIENRANPS